MKNKKILISIFIITMLMIITVLLITGRARTDVYLKSFKMLPDGKSMVLKVGISSSSGYIRKMKRTSGSMNYYFTFYSTYGFNSRLGAKDSFVIELDDNVDAIYFYKGNKGYKKILEKTNTGYWIKANN